MKLFVESPLSELSAGERDALMDRRPDGSADVERRVAAILAGVRQSGDAELLRLARELDGAELKTLEVPRRRWFHALERIPAAVRSALEQARDNVAAFHRAQLEALPSLRTEVTPGVVLERHWVPLDSVGVYAPGGRAAYASSVLMGVTPAVVAGVAQVVVCSPPGPDGLPSEPVLAAAALAGATRVFALGGAGAVAALAFGTRSVPAVGAVVGPGNAWVNEAKRQVAGSVRVDGPAGPSELLVVADGDADPRLVALELVAQAEHDPEAVVGLVTHDGGLVAAVRAALEEALEHTERRGVAAAALERRGFLLRAHDRREALDFALDFAPEHLAVLTRDPEADGRSMTTAGTVFLGPGSSVAFGDYMTGANHVLPTGGLARTWSGLAVDHYLRSYTVQRVSGPAAAAMARPVAELAAAEGLPAHGAAALARSGS